MLTRYDKKCWDALLNMDSIDAIYELKHTDNSEDILNEYYLFKDGNLIGDNEELSDIIDEYNDYVMHDLHQVFDDMLENDNTRRVIEIERNSSTYEEACNYLLEYLCSEVFRAYFDINTPWYSGDDHKLKKLLIDYAVKVWGEE